MKKKKIQDKNKIAKKSSIRFPEKMTYNSCTKDMKLHVLVIKVLKLNNKPLRNNFLGLKYSPSIHAVYSLCFSHGFPDCSKKTKPTAINGE